MGLYAKKVTGGAAAALEIIFAFGITLAGRTIHTSYNHLSTIDVAIGDQVDMNTKIGEVGHTGVSSGAHLHWEVYDGAITRRHRMPDGAHGDPDRMSHVDPVQALRLEQQIASGRVTPGGSAPA